MSSPTETLQSFSAVVVTGGSSGLGKSFIQLAATLKPELVICNLSRRNPGEIFSSTSGKNLNHFPCDLSRGPEVARAARAVRDWLRQSAPPGRVLLINNSGAGQFGRFAELDLERQLATVDLNVRAVVALTGLLLPELLQRGGAILNIASTVAYQPTPYAATYGAAKAFVLHWSMALSEELRQSPVRVLAVCPGTTATDFFRQAGVEGSVNIAAGMPPEDVAACALRALGSGRTQVVPGWRNVLTTLVASRLPKRTAAALAAPIFFRRRPAAGSP